MALLSFIVFGIITGVIVHWIHPENQHGGFAGAALTGGSGALIGAGSAVLLLQNMTRINLLLGFSLLVVVFLFSLFLFAPRHTH